MNHDSYLSSRQERIHYALAKQVPTLRMNVEIHTCYGPLFFHYKDAQRIASLVETLLERQLKRLCTTKTKPVTRQR